MKSLKKIMAIFLATGILMSGCAKQTVTPTDADKPAVTTEQDKTPATEKEPVAETAKEPAADATTATPVATESQPYVYIYTQELTTLNYLVSNKSVDSEAAALFVDTLLLNDKYGNLVPGIAKEWSVSADQLKWTFKLRDDVKWFKNDGTEYGKVTAQDFVTAAKYVLTQSNASQTADMVLGFVAGAQEFYDGKTTDFATVGVKAIDDYTVEYTLKNPTTFFPSLITYSCYLPVNEKFLTEVGNKFATDPSTILYNGSYLFKTWEVDKERIYEKNPGYYLADRIHIPSFKFTKVDDIKVRFEMYRRGEVSATPVMADQVDSIKADPVLGSQLFRTTASYATYYYQFNFSSTNADFAAAAKNLNFRKAMKQGFSRLTLLSIKNPSEPEYAMRNTLTAPNVALDENKKDYLEYGELPAIAAKDYYDLDAAKQSMAAAKTELGSAVTWPLKVVYPISMDEDGSTEGAIVKQMLEDAFAGDITVELQPYDAAKFYEMVDSKNWDMTQVGWSPDYADPSTYLDIVTPGGAQDNIDMGSIPEGVEYGKLVAEAKNIYTIKERFEAFAKAEAYLLNNALIIPMQANGGNYALNKIQNPYDRPSAAYGMSGSKWLDVIVGGEGISLEQRQEQKAKYEAEKAAQAK